MCEQCEFRFSTYEEIEILELSVNKRNGRVESYARDKLERGLGRALEKRPFASDVLKQVVSAVETEIQRQAKNGVISSAEIGELAMKQLRKADHVAYIRFASVYKQFEDIQEFKKALQTL